MRKTIAALIFCMAATACESSSAPPAPSAQLGNTMSGAVSKAILALPLIDSTGHFRRLSDYAGKIIVIDPILTLCQETCPLDTTAFTQVARSTAASPAANKVVFLTISVDPARDTPVQLAAYRKLYGDVSPNWVLLTGQPAVIERLWKYFGVWVQRVGEDRLVRNWRTGQKLTYDVNHGDDVIFIDARGQERFIIQGAPDVHGSKLPSALMTFMDSQGITNLKHPNTQAWTIVQALSVVSWLAATPIASVH